LLSAAGVVVGLVARMRQEAVQVEVAVEAAAGTLPHLSLLISVQQYL
jgi:hypothetical protein